jgi:predicted phage-related endonuclease
VAHYLSVTGYAFADVAALIGDHGLHYHQIRIMRDEEDIAAVESAVDTFWLDCVQGDKVPLAVAADAKAVTEVGSPGNDELMPSVSRDLADRIRDYVVAQEEARAAKAKADDLATGIKAALGQYKGCVTDTNKVTLARFERTSIDSKKLKEEYPDVFAECSKTSTSNRFSVKSL